MHEAWLQDEACSLFFWQKGLQHCWESRGFSLQKIFFSLLLSKSATIADYWLLENAMWSYFWLVIELLWQKQKTLMGENGPKGPWEERDGIQISSLQKNLAVEEVKNKTIKEQR